MRKGGKAEDGKTRNRKGGGGVGMCDVRGRPLLGVFAFLEAF